MPICKLKHAVESIKLKSDFKWFSNQQLLAMVTENTVFSSSVIHSAFVTESMLKDSQRQSESDKGKLLSNSSYLKCFYRLVLY